jgi:hypothetical protein
MSTRAELVAAVANSGALGFITAPPSPHRQTCRRRTPSAAPLLTSRSLGRRYQHGLAVYVHRRVGHSSDVKEAFVAGSELDTELIFRPLRTRLGWRAIPTVGDLVSRIVEEAEELITCRLPDMVEPEAEENVA